MPDEIPESVSLEESLKGKFPLLRTTAHSTKKNSYKFTTYNTQAGLFYFKGIILALVGAERFNSCDFNIAGSGTGIVLLNVISIDTNRLTQEVLDSHIRSLMLNHLEDVVSTDQHSVKPWFNGKLDFSPVVEDFANQGYPLIGGRLDYLDNQSVAVLVYQRGKHIINLFTWRNTETANSKGDLQSTNQQGFHLVHWTAAGSNYWVVSDLNESELGSFVQLVKSATGG